MPVIIGIDPHKSSHTATAVDDALVEVGTIRVRATRTMLAQLHDWAQQWPERRWAIEGARGLGQLLAQQLVTAGETVVDVPATLTARVRLLETGHGRKTDHIDARAVAIVAARRDDLAPVAADDHIRVLRLLADRRDELTRERRRTINRLHRHLRDLIPGGAPVHLSAKTATGLLNKVRALDAVTVECKLAAGRPRSARPVTLGNHGCRLFASDVRRRCRSGEAHRRLGHHRRSGRGPHHPSAGRSPEFRTSHRGSCRTRARFSTRESRAPTRRSVRARPSDDAAGSAPYRRA
jgi:hypothetical protein